MFVFLFLCIYTNPATGCYMNKTILYEIDRQIANRRVLRSLQLQAIAQAM